mmetsp:Transcript_7092/g.8117  ORF Transcript_7092/g.8117 Transcript_7092/m.8117 type:complete len:192 (-) Transcript_7092:1090-1665(-)
MNRALFTEARSLFHKRRFATVAARSLKTARDTRRCWLSVCRSESRGMLQPLLTPGTVGKTSYFDASKLSSRGFCSENEVMMDEGEFHDIADECLEGLEPALEVLDQYVEGDDFDVVYSQGVLTLDLGEYGSWVLNKQTPNRQIWWSSPISGPKRYRFDFESRRWINTRDGHDMLELLMKEIADTTGEKLDL